MPWQGTKGDAMESRGRKEGEGMVAAVLFVLRCAIEAATFLQIRDRFFMGLMGLMGGVGLMGRMGGVGFMGGMGVCG
jgi:hypothetical protein